MGLLSTCKSTNTAGSDHASQAGETSTAFISDDSSVQSAGGEIGSGHIYLG